MPTTPFITFAEAEAYIHSFIPSKSQLFRGSFGVERTAAFLEILGNPQEKVKTIHIAGTSGKGSTAYLTNILLTAHGFKTGLHVSPHLIDIRERFQINDTLLSEKTFVSYVNGIIPAIELLKKSEYGSPSYFELLVSLAFVIFADNDVDYTVLETGLGGLLDATNVIARADKLSLLTPIGKDHMKVLGSTLTEIAAQKAGIISSHSTVISTDQKKAVRAVFESAATHKEAALSYVEKRSNYSMKELSLSKTLFDFSYGQVRFANLELGLIGEHQVQNASLALAALVTLSKRDEFNIREKVVRKTLKHAAFPGRLERINTKHGTLLVDGAHNPPKMRALAKTLRKLYPNQKISFVVALKRGKDIRSTLKYLIPLAHHIYVTEFFNARQDTVSFCAPAREVAGIVNDLGYGHTTIVTNNVQAVSAAQGTTPVVITGSLYLLADLYPHLKDL
jgi:dihydrofolate synthase/folylpolyglutamate synthase